MMLQCVILPIPLRLLKEAQNFSSLKEDDRLSETIGDQKLIDIMQKFGTIQNKRADYFKDKYVSELTSQKTSKTQLLELLDRYDIASVGIVGSAESNLDGLDQNI